MTPEGLLRVIEGELREHLPPGITARALARFVERRWGELLILLSGAMPSLSVVEAILSRRDEYFKLAPEEAAQVGELAAQLDEQMSAELASIDTLTRDQENGLHLYIVEALDAALPTTEPWRNHLIVHDLALRIWTFYRRRLLARGVLVQP